MSFDISIAIIYLHILFFYFYLNYSTNIYHQIFYILCPTSNQHYKSVWANFFHFIASYRFTQKIYMNILYGYIKN